MIIIFARVQILKNMKYCDGTFKNKRIESFHFANFVLSMKHYKVLKTEEEYRKALDRTIQIFHAEPGNPEFEGAIEVRTGQAEPYVVNAGERARMGPTGVVAAGPAQARSLGWTQGMLLANDMPLGDFLAELGRHRQGYLGCDPAVARLKVSGSFPLADTDRILAVLQADLPIQVQQFTPYWTRVRPVSA